MKKSFFTGETFKRRGFILAGGSIILCGGYLAYLFSASQMGFASKEGSIIATIVFLVLYIAFYVLASTKNIAIIKQNKFLVLNICFLFVPLVIALLCYLLTQSFLLSIILFIIGQFAYTIYYKNYFPVPGYNKAYKTYLKGDIKKARLLLEQILSSYTNNFESLILLSVILIKETEYQKATELLERAKVQRPDNALVYINLSHAHTALENFEAAIENAKMTLELAPENWNACYTIAISGLFIDDYQQAIEYFDKTKRFKIPEQQVFLIHYGKAKALEGLNKNQEASKELEKAVQNAGTLTITYWKSQLEKLGNFTNRPSQLVKEAVEYVSSQTQKT